MTKKELNLCKQIAEKYRKEIKYADWYWSTSYNEPLLATDGGFRIKEQEHHGVFKIWTISDCLEFLKEKNRWVRMDTRPKEEGSTTRIWIFSEFNLEEAWIKHPSYDGKTPLEACLKAALAVLEE